MKKPSRGQGHGHHLGIIHVHLGIFPDVHGGEQFVTQDKHGCNFQFHKASSFGCVDDYFFFSVSSTYSIGGSRSRVNFYFNRSQVELLLP